MTGFGLGVVSFYFVFDIPLFDCIISIRLSDYPLVLLSMNAIFGFLSLRLIVSARNRQ